MGTRFALGARDTISPTAGKSWHFLSAFKALILVANILCAPINHADGAARRARPL